MALTATGTLSYNGWTFDPLVRSKVTATPHYDEARRTISYIDYIFDVKGYINARGSGSCDSSLTTLTQDMLTQAGEFKYTSKGFGAFQANAGGASDSAWGPHPQRFVADPIGNNQTFLVEWTCLVSLPICKGKFPQFRGQLMAWNYEADYSMDHQGLLTLTFTGYFEIPMTRSSQDSTSLPDMVDKYREQVAIPVAAGFQLESQDYKISKDKRRCDFRVVHKELLYALPLGVVRADLTHEVQMSKAFRFFSAARHSISGSLTMAPDQQKADAYNKFQVIVAARKKPQKKTIMFPDSFTVREEMFTNTTHFAISWISMGVQGISEHIKQSGLWTPIPGTSFAQWNQSLAKTNSVRGVGGDKLLESDDTLVDLCSESPDPPKPEENPDNEPDGPGNAKPQVQPCPDEANSWLGYMADFILIEEDRVVRHKPLNQKPKVPRDKLLGIDPPPKFDKLKDAANAEVKGGPDIEQRVSSPTYTVLFWGKALRLCYKITVPRLINVGGATLNQKWQIVHQSQVGQVDGKPIYFCEWQIEYICNQKPEGDLPIMTNPAID